MNKLWIFGDSFSEPFDKTLYANWRKKYIEWKGYTPLYYGEIISKELNLLHINLSISGLDNYSILDNIINVIDKIDKNDIIIIGWSSIGRFRLVDTNNKFKSILSNKFNKISNISQNTIDEIIINRLSSTYINELNNYIKLLNFTFKENKIIHWSPFSKYREGLNLSLSSHLYKTETIDEETNGEINDLHFSEKTHKILSKEFIDIIKSHILYKPLN